MKMSLLHLPTNILELILSFGDCALCPELSSADMFPAIRYISTLRKDIRPLYYRYCAILKKKVSLNCFIENRDEVSEDVKSLFEHPFMRFVFSRPELVIAGSFATQLFQSVSNLPKETSDIDIFVLNQSIAVLYYLLSFINSAGIEYIQISGSRNILQFRIPELKYQIQVILLESVITVHDIIQTFDMSHCRCVVYLGKVYATPDADYSLKVRRTLLYKRTRVCRLAKALHYADSIIGTKNTLTRENCLCDNAAKVEWQTYRTANITPVKMSFRDIGEYAHQGHTFVEFSRIRKEFDISAGAESVIPKLSYLEWFRSAPMRATFKLSYFQPDNIFHVNRYFYTKDKRFHKVYEFWKSKLHIIQSSYDAHLVAKRKRNTFLRFYRSDRDIDFQRILKPLDKIFTYFPVLEKGPTYWTDGEEYELTVVFRARNVFILNNSSEG